MTYARFQQKIDTSANWAKATNFIPLEGELIIYQDYDADNKPLTPKYKNGDGKTKVNDLPFCSVPAITNEEIDEICSGTLTTFLEDIASEEVSF